MIYTLTLSPCLDYVMEVPELRFGRVNRAANAHLRPGGKGLNVSILLSRFGIPNLALGFAAGFTGIEMERMLREEGCQTAFIRLPEGSSRINVKIEGAQAAEINAEGPPVPDKACEELMERLRELEDGDTLVLAGNIPKSLPQDLYEQILRRTDGRALRSVVDTTGEALQMALAHRPFLIKPNHLELGELFGVNVDRPDEVEPYARRLRIWGPGTCWSPWRNGERCCSTKPESPSALPPRDKSAARWDPGILWWPDSWPDLSGQAITPWR